MNLESPDFGRISDFKLMNLRKKPDFQASRLQVLSVGRPRGLRCWARLLHDVPAGALWEVLQMVGVGVSWLDELHSPRLTYC